MTRSMIKNICAWFRSCFWDKIFMKKSQQVQRIGTPQFYYKAKARQQTESKSQTRVKSIKLRK